MDENVTKLSNAFDKGFKIIEDLKESPLSTNDKQFQVKVSEGIKHLEDCTRLVNELSLFSSNESVEEIATINLKYLLLPALLADLTLKSLVADRSEVLETAEIYFNDFIQRLNDYGICDIDLKKEESKESAEPKSTPSMASLDFAVHNRNAKIQRYKETKQMEGKLSELKLQMSQTEDTDDEIVRDFFLTLIKRWINHSLEELNGIEMEKPMVEHMKQMKALNKDTKQSDKMNKSQTNRLRPMIITRNELQKKVYGLGYPSIPTVSIDDFVSQKIEEGSLAITDPNIYSNSLLDWAENPEKKMLEDETEEERKERLVEREDLEALRRARDMDDWKDVHQRGEGNRKNMG